MKMKQVLSILDQLSKTSSTKEKENILRQNSDNELLKQVIYYTYNPYLRFKMTLRTINPTPCESMIDEKHTIFSVLDILANSNINDTIRANVNAFLGAVEDEEVRQLYINMILKDLKIKCNTKTFNKVWKNLIPSFSVMLAEKYWDYTDRVKGMFTLTMKMDGHRCVLIKENGRVSFFTRQGQPYEGLVEIEEVAKEMSLDNIVIDGELLISNFKEIDPKDRYKTTTKIIRQKGEKRGVSLVCFDIIPLEEFQSGNCKIPYNKRRVTLENLVEETNSEYLKIVEKLYNGEDTSKIVELLDEVVKKGEEGLMINFDEAPYKLTRTTNILKVKKMLTADVRVVNVYQGEEGKEFENTMGGVTFEFIHESKVYTCDCGSGFKVAERDKYWNNPSLIIGKIIEVHYFEVTTNEQGTYGLRFPIFKGIREDKFEISMA